jgi:hypothetical protein
LHSKINESAYQDVLRASRHFLWKRLTATRKFCFAKLALGALAQMGERLICIQEVRSSILLGSTTFHLQSKLNGGRLLCKAKSPRATPTPSIRSTSIFSECLFVQSDGDCTQLSFGKSLPQLNEFLSETHFTSYREITNNNTVDPPSKGRVSVWS